jgi:hypothetical protein
LSVCSSSPPPPPQGRNAPGDTVEEWEFTAQDSRKIDVLRMFQHETG